ncbi:nucleotidyltransferase domain-containing protein [Kineosporiaceae bacterium SCSIO 59966]|nr:nucleotidyltransferase domain-containing protein [Kineosporiaceae bacterium SCSIO 59966]
MAVRQAVETLLRAVDDGSLARLCERHDVEILTLFGSARTDPASARDVDIGVRFRGRATPDPVPLIGDLMDLLSTDAVDVLLVDRATPTGRFAALVEARRRPRRGEAAVRDGRRRVGERPDGRRSRVLRDGVAATPRPRTAGPMTPSALQAATVQAKLRLMRDPTLP